MVVVALQKKRRSDPICTIRYLTRAIDTQNDTQAHFASERLTGTRTTTH